MPAGGLVATEDLRAAVVEQPVRDELVDRSSGLEGRVQLDYRVRPEQSLFELTVDVLRDPFVVDNDEAAGVVRVVGDKPFSKIENVDRSAPFKRRLQPRMLLPSSRAILRASSPWHG
jgi:hypothetical protein